MTNTTAVPDLPAHPTKYCKWLDVERKAIEAYGQTCIAHYIATQPAPSGDAVEVLRANLLREALESLYQMTSRYAITDTDYGIVCNAAAALGASYEAKAKDTPESMANSNARFAIDGAIQYGRENRNAPPSADHWLHEYWSIGRQLATLGATGWDNVTPLATTSRAATVAASERSDEAKRLRRVVRAMGMESEVPADDESLRDCLFAVLGQIALKLESSASIAAKDAGKSIYEIQRDAAEQAISSELVSLGLFATPKPEASAANQQAGEFSVAQLPYPAMVKGAFDYYSMQQMRAYGDAIYKQALAEADIIHKGLVRAMAGSNLAAPISEGTGMAEDYPAGDILANCVCGSWPGGKCLRCPRIAAPDACNGDALPPLPISLITDLAHKHAYDTYLTDGHASYNFYVKEIHAFAKEFGTAYVLADRAARAGTGSAGSSIDSTPEFRTLVARHRLALDSADYDAARAAWVALVSYIDTRATKVEAAPGNAGEGDADRLLHISRKGINQRAYAAYVLRRGGNGGLSDIRSYLDAVIEAGKRVAE